jgi:hypothetical protein
MLADSLGFTSQKFLQWPEEPNKCSKFSPKFFRKHLKNILKIFKNIFLQSEEKESTQSAQYHSTPSKNYLKW